MTISGIPPIERIDLPARMPGSLLAFGINLVFIMSLTVSFKAAADINFSGSVAAEARIFTQDPRYTEQSESDDYSLFLQPELRYEAAAGRITMVPFYRHDSIDDERSHFDIRELNWRHSADRWDLLIGVDRVFWGVTESRHLVDIINQVDLIENIDQEDKLGQPMIRFNWLADWGNLSAFVLPGFRERTFPGPDGRLRSALPVSSDAAVYESSQGDSHIDLALRYSQVIGDWDVGAYYFTGTGREPRLIPDASGQFLIPHYDLIQQLAIDAQLTAESWLWKFEGINRRGQGKNFLAAVAGLEYTWYQIAGSNADLGILAELLYDGRDDSAPPTLLDRDIFLGLRLGMNDIDDSQYLVGLIYDEEKDQNLFTLEGKRRLNQHLSIELEAWQFNDSDSASLDFNQDDYVQLQLVWHF